MAKAEGALLRAGDRVAILSPAFAAPAVAPAVHERAMQRLQDETGLIPVEYPTTRQLDASARDRARDVDAAYGDPSIRALLATIGGSDQITVVPHLDPDLPRADPKPFIGYSDNTHILNWLWQLGSPAFHGGSTQVHLGAGPAIDAIHRASLRAALLAGGSLQITEPGESEDFGLDWSNPLALSEFGARAPTPEWFWAGPPRSVVGRTWGGCLEVLVDIALAGRLPAPEALEGAVLLLETSEELPSATWVASWVRALGEAGVLAAVDGVLLARPPVSSPEHLPPPAERDALRAAQRDAVIDQISRYNPDAVVVAGVPFGHTRPQWILPYGGLVELDGADRRVVAHYGKWS